MKRFTVKGWLEVKVCLASFMADDAPLPHDRGHELWTVENGASRKLMASFNRWTEAMVGADGASLVAAAVWAAILAKVPRRTVYAPAVAVTGAIVHQPPALQPRTKPREQVLEALRAAPREHRRKKEGTATD